MDGFFNLLKPPGMSSGAMVNEIKYLTGERCGHAGTLDPEAAGVLPIMVGRATRLLDYFSGSGKEYIAEIAFTGATDTQDAQGRLILEGRGVPGEDELAKALPHFTGDILQQPPAYSALKRDGVPLYKLARAGQTVVTRPRPARIDSIRLLRRTGDGYLIRVSCGGGTYIRTLCHDIGLALGRPAHMRFLLRTRVGSFGIENAVTLEEMHLCGAEKRLEEHLLPCEYPLSDFPCLDVPAGYKKAAVNGVALPARLFQGAEAGTLCLMRVDGAFLGIAERTGDVMKFRVIVRDHNEFV